MTVTFFNPDTPFGDWRRSVPVWAMSELEKLRRVWVGTGAPTGEIVSARRFVTPPYHIHGVTTPPLDTVEVVVTTREGEPRLYYFDRPLYED